MSAPTPVAPAGGDRNGGPAILAVCMTTLGISVCCVCMRCYIRIRMTASFWWDDAFIILAAVLSIIGAAFVALGVQYGAGRHTYYLQDPLTQVPAVVKWNTAYQIDNVLSVNMVKVSILLFIIRLQNNRILAWTSWITMFIMSVVNLVTVVALASQCRPLQKLWDDTIQGTCMREGELTQFGIAQGVINVITDLYCAIMPIVIMWRVKIPTRTKVVICILTSLGLAATASQIVRVILLDSLEAEDYSYQILGIVIAAILDQNIGIIAACIPTFRPLFKSFDRVRTRKTTAANPSGYVHDSHNKSKKQTYVQMDGGKSFDRDSNESELPLRELPEEHGGIIYKRSYEVRSDIAEERKDGKWMNVV